MKKIIHLLIAFHLTLITASAQYQTLHNFDTADGRYMQCKPVLSGKTLYGMTPRGGTVDSGFIFSVDTTGNNYKVLFNFGGANGSYPCGSLTLAGGRLYGTTNYGAHSNQGVIFSMDTNGTGYKILLYNFSSGANNAIQDLTILGNKMYGTTYEGGTNGEGVLYTMDTNGANYRVLYNFDPSNAGGIPQGALVLSGSTLFGIAYLWNLTYGGCVFAIDTSGNTYRQLYKFNTVNTQFYSPLCLVGKTLYGTALIGGASDSGYVYSIDTNGTNYKDLLDFNGPNGSEPYSGALLSDGSKLYGTTSGGGGSAYGGTVFSVDTNGTEFNYFGFNTAGEGLYPLNGLVKVGGTVFGTTYLGGTKNEGTIFKLGLSQALSVNTLTANTSSAYVYPNPSNGVFTFQSSVVSHKPSVLEVYNMLGEKVYSKQLTTDNSQFIIDLSNNTSGIYLYRISSEDGTLNTTGKLIIE